MQQSKPLHPRNGRNFYPDKTQPIIRMRYIRTKGPFKVGRLASDKTYTRIDRKRQRRVNEYMIQLGLDE